MRGSHVINQSNFLHICMSRPIVVNFCLNTLWMLHYQYFDTCLQQGLGSCTSWSKYSTFNLILHFLCRIQLLLILLLDSIHCSKTSIKSSSDPTYMIRAIPSNASDNIYCTLLAQSAVHGAMAGYTGFTVGPVNSRHAYIPISVSTSILYSGL